MQTEVLARLDDRGADFFAFRIRSEDFQARSAGHAMTQRADLASGDGYVIHVKKLDIRDRAAVQLFNYLFGVRTLNLVAVALADDRLAAGTGRRAIVLFGGDVVAAGFGVELNPIGGGRAPDEYQLVLFHVKQNTVADNMAAVAAGHELFRAVHGELGEAIDRQVRKQFESVRALDVHIYHVMRLIEQHAGFAPRTLFVAPVREFAGYHRIYIGSDLRIAQQVHGVPDGL